MSSYRIVGDWGTSRLRLFRIENGKVVDQREGPGIGSLRTPPEELLRAALLPWRSSGAPASIRLCGMVGSRNGWIDVPYVDCPADAAAWRRGTASLLLDGVPVEIMAGLATAPGTGSPDVMRGEETQIFGAMAQTPALASGRATIVLPGTHSKWVSVEHGRITGFRTFLTGELFAVLRDHSTLTRAAAEESVPAAQNQGFEDGLVRARDDGHLLGALFTARSMQLREGRSHAWALGYLSGLIIGCEVAEATASFAAERGVALVGDPKLAAHYEHALGLQGIRATIHDGDASALAGLALAETPP